ncbi:efflux RND transporter periplasmic adaptor subunit [Shewanella colwelliana]|uniref:efflux RND transporter periplasmic adaptor subunit n=1 Tax=Shewanella colwelliana TaxID=23 RepID=UPI00048D1EB6|nr:efflux RND transporter periplasmic adaptor subunit [Shewanella colwelliana]
MKKTLCVTVLLIVVLSLLAYSQLGEARKSSDKPVPARVVPIVSGLVSAHQLSQHISLIGKLEASRSVLIAAEVAGKIKHIGVEANQAISANQTLVVIKDTKSKANVAEAKAYLSDEQRKLAEFSKLITKNAITQTEIDAQKASVDIAQARLQAAQAQLDFHTIKAPFGGTAGLVDFSLGKMVSAGTELLSLDDLSSMRLDIQVPEVYLSRLTIGMQVTATNRAWQGEIFTGQVIAIDPRINPETLNLKVRVNFDNSEHKLKPGMLMSANVGFAPISEPVIPVQALEYSGTKRFVYVIDADNRAKRTEVSLGARIGDEVLISQGVKVGERIVVQGLVNMRDGLQVDDLSSQLAEGGKVDERGRS